MTTFPEAVRIQLKNLCGILNDGPDADTMARVRQVAVALSSLCACEGVGGHPVPEVTVDISEQVRKLGDFFCDDLPDVQVFAAGGPVGRAMAETRNRICASQSPGSPDDADDPPVTCSRERGHDGQHEGGCRGVTASWSGCGSCHTCLDGLAKMTMMVLCITCGNKRCPKADDHDNECSGSNEPGQKGSAYE